MDLETARLLTSGKGRRLLEAAAGTRALAAHRRPAALAAFGDAGSVRLALAQDRLRLRAAARCPHAQRFLFTEEALEQASAWPVAEERARRWRAPPGVRLTDLTAGIGLDALAAAVGGRPVLAFEHDPARAHLLAANAEALGVGSRIEVRVEDCGAAPRRGALAFLDPGRRKGGRKSRSPAAFLPPSSAWAGLLGGFGTAAVKLPPVVTGPLPLEGRSEWVSLDGRLRERRLWRGDAGFEAPRRALRLPGGQSIEGAGTGWPEPRRPEVGQWLLDPDPAVTVGGLVGDLAARDALRPIHPRIAYLLGPAPSAGSPGTWVRIAAILAPTPRAVDRWLRTVDGARPVVRTRGVALDAGAFAGRLHPAGTAATTVVLTRDLRDRWVALAGRMTQE